MSAERWTVEMVCTDRGQHKRTWMARFIWDAEPGAWRTFIAGAAPTHDMFGPPIHDAEPGAVTSRESYGFACSRCTRWPKIGRDRMVQILDGARRGGLHELDVSRLD